MLVHGRCAERMWVCIDSPDHWVPKKQALWQTLLLFYTLRETLHHFTASKALLPFFLGFRGLAPQESLRSQQGAHLSSPVSPRAHLRLAETTELRHVCLRHISHTWWQLSSA